MRKQLSFIAVLLAIGATADCASPTPDNHAQNLLDATPASPPPTLTPEEERESAAAKQAYISCLDHAAHYADQGVAAVENAAALIAPMCYPQFAQFQAAAAAGLSARDRRTFDHDGDKRQLEFAGNAIRQKRSVAALATGQ